MTTNANLKNLAVSETGFVFDPSSGATFTVNSTGLAVLLALRDGASTDRIVAELVDRFEGAPADVRDDVLDFVLLLRQHGLLPHEAATRAVDNGAARAVEGGAR